MRDRFLFDVFCLEPYRHRLLKNDREIHLEPRIFQILWLLVRDAPATVTHEKLLADVWNETPAPPLSDGARPQQKMLAQSIYVLRKLLGDKGKPSPLIVSRARVGYALDAEVSTDLLPPPMSSPVSPAGMPGRFTLSTKRTNPQWADFCDYVAPPVPWVLRCKVLTDSMYFRVGFKVFREAGRLFGDTSLLSSDPNLLVHLGRNYWSRPGISKKDLFLSGYANGIRVDNDIKLFRVPKRVTAEVTLTVDSGFRAWLHVNGQSYFHHQIAPEACRRVAILAWGDHDEYSVEIADMSLTTPQPLGIRA